MSQLPVKLLDQVLNCIRMKHYSIGTKETDVSWIQRFILLHNNQH
jgi:hypothetical protein